MDHIKFSQEVRDLIGVGAWARPYEIKEALYKELAIEALSIFDVDLTHLSFHLPDTIKFMTHSEWYTMSCMQFNVHIGLYS